MVMVAFSKTVLLRGVGTRESLLDTKGMIKSGERSINIFRTIITLEIFDKSPKYVFNHSHKFLKMRKYFGFTTHGINS